MYQTKLLRYNYFFFPRLIDNYMLPQGNFTRKVQAAPKGYILDPASRLFEAFDTAN